MKLYFAPLEGLTDSIYRTVHAAQFGGADKYFTPFLAPNQNHCFSGREKRDILPENNHGLPVVPQLLTNHAEHFLWAAQALADLGYREINLNLGCPSGTVTAKKKGAGQLADLPALERFLETIFLSSPLPISIKTRLGLNDPAEFTAILSVFCRYPLAELILHPRVRNEFYQGVPHGDRFAEALSKSPFPVCYNGDLFTPADVKALLADYPTAKLLMIGRGALANPGLFAELRGQKRFPKSRFQSFHDRLYHTYRAAFSGERPVLCRMKELWHYYHWLFAGSDRFLKKLRKASSLQAYEATVTQIFQTCEIVSSEAYPIQF